MNCNRAARRGISLIELGTVLAITSVLLMTVAVLFSSLLQGQRQFLLRDRQRREFARLDAMLRSDAHAANVVVSQGPAECELKNNEGDRWTYRASDDKLTRERFQADKLVQRESYYLRPGTKINFSVKAEGDRSWLLLELEPPSAVTTTGAVFTSYSGQMLVGGMLPGASVKEQP